MVNMRIGERMAERMEKMNVCFTQLCFRPLTLRGLCMRLLCPLFPEHYLDGASSPLELGACLEGCKMIEVAGREVCIYAEAGGSVIGSGIGDGSPC
jgi:hypothetical protein